MAITGNTEWKSWHLLIWLSYLYAVCVIFFELCLSHKSKMLFLFFSFVWDFCVKAKHHCNKDFFLSPFLWECCAKAKGQFNQDFFSLPYSSFVWEFCAKAKYHFNEDLLLSPFHLLFESFLQKQNTILTRISLCLLFFFC